MSYRCNLCSNSQYKVLGHYHGRDLVHCLQCGLRSYTPLPTNEELEALYAAESYTSSTYFTLDDAIDTNHLAQMRDDAATLAAALPPGSRILEVGAGRGHFLHQFAQSSFNLEAIELSSPMADTLRERFNCPVWARPLEECPLPAGQYQAVAAYDLLEHVRDPMLWLQKAWRLLAPGGFLMFSTVSVTNALDACGRLLQRAGVSGGMAKLHPPYHLYYFSPQLIRLYLERTGFLVETLRQVNYDARKAAADPIARLALRTFYFWHNISGNRTNLYLTCRKHR